MSIEAIRFRAGEAGVILQVLETRNNTAYYGERGEWRDAKVEDLLEVARYTRSYDALDNLISGLQNQVSGLQDQMGRMSDKQENGYPAMR